MMTLTETILLFTVAFVAVVAAVQWAADRILEEMDKRQ